MVRRNGYRDHFGPRGEVTEGKRRGLQAIPKVQNPRHQSGDDRRKREGKLGEEKTFSKHSQKKEKNGRRKGGGTWKKGGEQNRGSFKGETSRPSNRPKWGTAWAGGKKKSQLLTNLHREGVEGTRRKIELARGCVQT